MTGASGGTATAVAPRAGARIETICRTHGLLARALSLPARERGSKPLPRDAMVEARECRSPRGSADRNNGTLNSSGTLSQKSLPARERGSKRLADGDHLACPAVAPRAGARIETARPRSSPQERLVAPRAGARIETLSDNKIKLRSLRVAPRAGARIETPCPPSRTGSTMSLPARERGSKLSRSRPAGPHDLSLPARERGSKHHHCQARGLSRVSLPARERGSKQSYCRVWRRAYVSLPARERGSKHYALSSAGVVGSRSPRGSADRNSLTRFGTRRR